MNHHRAYELVLQSVAAQGHGLPEERYARIAARRAFVEMKQCFMRATADTAGRDRPRLIHAVRQAREAIELWRLRDDILAALPRGCERAAAHRMELHRQLDSVFPDTLIDSHHSAL